MDEVILKKDVVLRLNKSIKICTETVTELSGKTSWKILQYKTLFIFKQKSTKLKTNPSKGHTSGANAISVGNCHVLIFIYVLYTIARCTIHYLVLGNLWSGH